MSGGKQAPQRRSEPSPKCVAIDLGMKRRIICKYEGGQSLSAIAHELGPVVNCKHRRERRWSHNGTHQLYLI
jgi:hypothetical protein